MSPFYSKATFQMPLSGKSKTNEKQASLIIIMKREKGRKRGSIRFGLCNAICFPYITPSICKAEGTSYKNMPQFLAKRISTKIQSIGQATTNIPGVLYSQKPVTSTWTLLHHPRRMSAEGVAGRANLDSVRSPTGWCIIQSSDQRNQWSSGRPWIQSLIFHMSSMCLSEKIRPAQLPPIPSASETQHFPPHFHPCSQYCFPVARTVPCPGVC